MESKYLLQISEYRLSYRYLTEEQGAAAEAAAERLQRKCKENRPFVSIHIKNPRYPFED
ncbi:hypothetical protein D3C79_49690 [compost metagenome]